MAKQASFIKLEGTMGDVTFFKAKDGFIAKQKTAPNADSIATGANFQRTRENNSEFGRAGKAAKLMRIAVHSLLKNAKDSKGFARLTKEMMRVLKADATSIRGQRNVVDGEAELLQGFEFNGNASFNSIFFPAYIAAIDRVAGTLSVNIPALIPNQDILIPEGTTHFAVVSAAAEIDFETGQFTEASTISAVLPWNGNAAGPIAMSNAVTPNSTHPLFLLLGVQFYQQVNGINYTLKNGAFNPLNIVKVSGI